MPWKVRDVMEQRMEFILRVKTGDSSMSELCREYGISRQTGYKWIYRYEEAGSFSKVKEQSRMPHNSPGKVSEEEELRVVELRERYGWGGKKLYELLREEGREISVRTINRIIKRRGLIRGKEIGRGARIRFEKERANELWQMDFKGEYKMDKGICYPLSILDDHSRFGLGLYALGNKKFEGVNKSLINTFEKYGLPEGMLMDHGTPWWSTTNGYGLTRLSVELMKQGIKLYYSGIGHPQTQGKVERFHRTSKESVKHKGKPERLDEWDRMFREFLHEYNYIRPHEGISMEMPVRRYSPSNRCYNPNPREWEYRAGLVVKTVNSVGCIEWNRRRYFICEALRGERVGVQKVDRLALVSFRHMYIREINTDTGRTTAILQSVTRT